MNIKCQLLSFQIFNGKTRDLPWSDNIVLIANFCAYFTCLLSIQLVWIVLLFLIYFIAFAVRSLANTPAP